MRCISCTRSTGFDSVVIISLIKSIVEISLKNRHQLYYKCNLKGIATFILMLMWIYLATAVKNNFISTDLISTNYNSLKFYGTLFSNIEKPVLNS
jgi:hypothetical protein